MRILILLLLFIFCGLSTQGQSIEDLKKSMERAEADISRGNKLLDINKSQTSLTVSKIIITNKNLSNREKIVASGRKQVSLIKRDIGSRNNEITNLSKKLKEEKSRYSKMMASAYKNFLSSNNLFFILSSSSIQDLHLRLYYLQRYSKMKINLAESIKENTKKITGAVEKLSDKKMDLDRANTKVSREASKLREEKAEHNKMHSELTSENKKLRQQVEKSVRFKKSLEKQIAKIIAEDNKARSKTKISTKEIRLSSDFDKNRGKLPFPVAEGMIIERFGTHKHPLYPTILVDNKGIDYAVPNNSDVMSVYDGEVTRVFFLQGLNNSIMVRHGEFITVYAGLTVVNVKKGDMVSTGEVLGKISTSQGTPTLHFEIYKGTTVQNPEHWLRK